MSLNHWPAFRLIFPGSAFEMVFCGSHGNSIAKLRTYSSIQLLNCFIQARSNIEPVGFVVIQKLKLVMFKLHYFPSIDDVISIHVRCPGTENQEWQQWLDQADPDYLGIGQTSSLSRQHLALLVAFAFGWAPYHPVPQQLGLRDIWRNGLVSNGIGCLDIPQESPRFENTLLHGCGQFRKCLIES